MITQISFTNFKGSTGEYRLMPRTIITGENFAGKTTIVQAIQLAATGVLPGIGRTAPAIFQASSGTMMQVAIKFSSGESIERTWKQTGKKGTVKATSAGSAVELNLLNGEQFTAAKTGDRLDMLAKLADGKPEELDKLVSRTRQAMGIKSPPGTDTVFEEAELVLEALAERLAAARARKLQFEKTIQGLAEIGSETAVPPPPDTLAAFEQAKQEADRAIAASVAAEEASEEAQDARDELGQFMLSDTQPPGDISGDLNQAHDDFRILEAEYQRTLQAMNEASGTATTALENYDPKWHAELEELAKTNWPMKQGELHVAVRDGDTRWKVLDNRLMGLLAELDQLEQATCCGTCGASSGNWKAGMKAALETRILETKKEIDETGLALEQNRKELEIAAVNNRQIQTLVDYRTLQTRHQKQKEARDFIQANEGVLEGKRKELIMAEEQLEALKAKAQDLGRHHARHEEWKRLTRLADQLAKRREELQAAYAAETEAVAKSDRCRAIHEAAQVQREQWENNRRREQDLAKARTESDAEDKIIEGLKSQIKTLTDLKETELRRLYAPVVDMAKDFSEGLLPSPLDLHPTTGQIGRYEGTVFIPYPLMSGAEQITALAALQAALAIGGSRILIIDELSRMTPATKAKLIATLDEAVYDGRLVQVILVDHSPDLKLRKDWLMLSPA